MKFRNRILLFGLAAAALAALAVFLSAGRLIQRSVHDHVTERLRAEARLLAELPVVRQLLGAGPTDAARLAEADALADGLGHALGLRVTLVAPDGTVLGDSAVDRSRVAGLENHGARPEIVAARAGDVGLDERASASVNEPFLYLAQRVEQDGRELGFVRLAMPDAAIRRTTGGYSWRLSLISFLALLAVAALGYLAARRFSRPIEQLSATADAIAAGRRDLHVDYAAGDELGQLGAALNRMTRSLAEQIDALTAEKTLRDTLLEGMSEGLLVVDRERRVLLCNTALRGLLGLRRDDPAGRPLIEVVREQAVLEAFDAVLEREEWRRDNVRFGAGRGGIFELTVAPLAGPDGAPVGALGLVFDVTRLTALESVRREFVADVSHELRTPLTSIKAFVETLLAGGLEDAANNRRFLEIVKKHGDRMEAILDDLTDLSLIETGSIALEREPVDLTHVARDLIETLRPRASAHQVEVAVEIPAGLRVLADRRRLEQVLLNLLDNAIKFNRAGGSVTIRAAGVADGVRLVVEDTGIGIPAAALDRIFHRFYRVDRARSRELGGTGLGLSIVKHLMRLHGGSVRVESDPGRGTRFIVEFPGEPVSR